MSHPYTARLATEVRTLRFYLKRFDDSLRRLAPLFSNGALANSAYKSNGRALPRLSAKARASMVLQGRYMGYMRQLNPRQKAQVRNVRMGKGVRVAIARARELAQV